jgi:formylglycine-generating enzyme required for sulfatase activity
MTLSKKNRQSIGAALGLGLLAALVMVGCSDDDSDMTCAAGTQGCVCYGNGTCDPGLACRPQDDRCVADPCAVDTTCALMHRNCETQDASAVCTTCVGGYHEADGECVRDEACRAGYCSGHGVCVEQDGVAYCACHEGYVGAHCAQCDEAAGYHLDGLLLECTTDPCDPDPCADDPARVCDPQSGACVCPPDTCDIAGECVSADAQSPDRGCMICDPETQKDDWSLAAAETICRPKAGECDLAERCDGVSEDCPADEVVEAGTACGSIADSICDHPDTCDGQGSCLPNYAPASTLCRDALAGPCDVADYCDGQGGCPDNVKPQGTDCDDSDPCTYDELCDGQSGGLESCRGTAYTCNDHGTCNSEDAFCTCHPGYAGDHCAVCDTNYQDNDENGTCKVACAHPAAPSCGVFVCDDFSGTAACLSPGFVPAPPGTLEMGSPGAEPGRRADEAQHPVSLSRPFEGADHEVTQQEWRTVAQWFNTILDQLGAEPNWIGEAPSYHASCDACPVERVNWYEAVLFANLLSAMSGLETCYYLGSLGEMGNPGEGCQGPSCDGFILNDVMSRYPQVAQCSGYRLATEAEWEYLARAGSQTAFYPTNETDGEITDPHCAEPNLDPIAWYCGNASSAPALPAATHPGGGKAANAWGFYDVLGNVREWVWDRYRTDYENDLATDPQGPTSGFSRLIRGGSFESTAEDTRVAARLDVPPTERNRNLGFRLVRTLDPDGDGVDTYLDNCPSRFNPDQADYDADGVGNVCAPWQRIEAGTFVMGSPSDEPFRDATEVQHSVTLTRSFEIMTSEVSEELCQDIYLHTDDLPGELPSCNNRSFESEVGDIPIAGLRLSDMAKLANKLSWHAGTLPCYVIDNDDRVTLVPELTSVYECSGYRLPTEAEWEYAARVRGGVAGAYYPTAVSDGTVSNLDPALAGEPNLEPLAWYGWNAPLLDSVFRLVASVPCAAGPSCGPYPPGGPVMRLLPADLAMFEVVIEALAPTFYSGTRPNSGALYDMLGNVAEATWTADHPYTADAVVDPEYPRAAPTEPLIVRGGSFRDLSSECRIAHREIRDLHDGLPWVGFRLVRTLDADEDGLEAYIDNCPAVANPGQTDMDFDGFGDSCDAFPLDPTRH